MDDVIGRLERWFEKFCNGEWENDFGVTITSTDNPGWWVKIDLRGTNLEHKSFEEISIGDASSLNPRPPWMRCYVDENCVFNGAGDAMQLQEILESFLRWAEIGRASCRERV